jgi:hypothetical protein
MMRPITYYRGALALPLVSPLVVWTFIQAGVFREFTGFLFGSILFGAIPYALATVILIVASTKMADERFEFWWHLAPFIAALMFMVSMSAIFVFQHIRNDTPREFEFQALAGACLVGGIYCLAVGYVYVIIAKLFFWLLKTVKVIVVVPREGPFT